MGIIYISTLFFNFCLHRLQKLNYYNHDFFASMGFSQAFQY
jgi:hypothetical protein